MTDREIQISLASDVLCAFGKSDIRPDAEAALKHVLVVISANPGGAVRIEGHTDSVGADDYNQKLSERRAESVSAWLVSNGGIDASRIQTRGFGETKPWRPTTRTRAGRKIAAWRSSSPGPHRKSGKALMSRRGALALVALFCSATGGGVRARGTEAVPAIWEGDIKVTHTV